MKTVLLSIFALILFGAKLSAQSQSWQQRGFSFQSDTTVSLNYPEENLSQLSIEVRCAIKERSSKKLDKCFYGIQWQTNDNHTLRITVHDISSKSILFDGQNEVEVRGTLLSGENSEIIFSKILNKNVSTDGGANTLQIIFRKDSSAEINFGNSFLTNQIPIPLQYSSIPRNAYLTAEGKVRVILLSSKWKTIKQNEFKTNWNISQIKSKITDDIGNNAIWKYLDRETDNNYTRLGGLYQIATVEENNGEISIIYISGAKTNNSIWKEGMLKGRLKKSLLENNYDLQWYDSDMNLLNNECHATISDDRKIITFNFPLLKSSLRFIRMPMDM